MSDAIKVEEHKNTGVRPVQILPYSQKDKDWYISNANHILAKSRFGMGDSTSHKKDYETLYGVYNNEFPMKWFDHITDPLSATKKEHKNFPAKIRPVNILRTNIDLLLGEFPRRPYTYNITNLGDSGYNKFMEGMKEQAQSTLTEHFIQEALQQMQASGQEMTEEQMQQLQQQPPIPEEVKAEFVGSFKDTVTVKAQKWLRRIVKAEQVKKKHHRMFKDWLIAGEAYSYKAIENDKVVFRRVSPDAIDFDKSHDTELIEDGQWVVHRRMSTMSEIVDRHFMTLNEEHLKDMEKNSGYSTPDGFYGHIQGVWGKDSGDRIPEYHVQWKGKKKVGFLSYLDPETFKMVEEEVDEDYVLDKERGDKVEWRYKNEVYEVWVLNRDIYTQMRACPVQRTEENAASCKLSYNGRKYSDTLANPISVLEFGIPFQVLYIIVTYTLEKTIAKSKGKILLMDQATVPNSDGWDEEKFFYYAESMGYALLNRNQIGVDKSWNQYQVLDMSLFDSIKQLIDIQSYLKQQWDDIIGISRQRKGETMASDGEGVNERSVFQSTVITDMIFIGFEELIESDLQGLMDLGKFATANGMQGTYNADEYATAIFEILPEDLSLEDLGVYFDRASDQLNKLQEMKQYAQAMIQNGHKASTVLEIMDSINLSELRIKLKQIEEIDAQMEQQQQEGEQQAAAAADDRKMKYREFEEMLTRETMHEEYGEKQDLEFTKGTFATFTFKDGDSNDNGVPDAGEAAKILNESLKTQNMFQEQTENRKLKVAELATKQQKLQHDMQIDRENVKLGKEKNKIAMKKASQRPAAKKS